MSETPQMTNETLALFLEDCAHCYVADVPTLLLAAQRLRAGEKLREAAKQLVLHADRAIPYLDQSHVPYAMEVRVDLSAALAALEAVGDG